jgi:hypothetical protein
LRLTFTRVANDRFSPVIGARRSVTDWSNDRDLWPRQFGLAALAEAEMGMGQSGERWPEPEIHRLKGELTLSMEGAGA